MHFSFMATGDEHLSWLHDEAGYLIVRDPGDGRLVYAVREGGRVRPSRLVVGRDDPVAAGLPPGLRPEPGEPDVGGCGSGREPAGSVRL